MNKSTIQTLIDKVIGKKGLIRVPSWWMRKVLMQMADWVQEGDDANGEKIVKVKEEADGKISTLETNVNTLETNVNTTDGKIDTLKAYINNRFDSLNTSLNSRFSATYNRISAQENDANNIFYELVETAKLPMSIKCFAVKTESQSGVVYVDEKEAQSIPANTKKVISFVNTFSIRGEGISFIGFGSTDTSAVTSMASMFSGCSKLTSLDVTGFNTSAVTTMQEMFANCQSLTSLDVTGFNTSAVTSMHAMFSGCRNLTSLDLTSFDTSAVTDMYYMFDYCESLTSLDLSSFDTSAVTTMQEMFADCQSLTSLILGPNFFKTSKVKSIRFSFSTKWTNDTVVTSLVTNSYDRATAGLSTMTLQLSANTKAALTDEQKAAITAKGYTIA